MWGAWIMEFYENVSKVFQNTLISRILNSTARFIPQHSTLVDPVLEVMIINKQEFEKSIFLLQSKFLNLF
jgi:hypothetical protein